MNLGPCGLSQFFILFLRGKKHFPCILLFSSDVIKCVNINHSPTPTLIKTLSIPSTFHHFSLQILTPPPFSTLRRRFHFPSFRYYSSLQITSLCVYFGCSFEDCSNSRSNFLAEILNWGGKLRLSGCFLESKLRFFFFLPYFMLSSSATPQLDLYLNEKWIFFFLFL